jgi:hypothetical protein
MCAKLSGSRSATYYSGFRRKIKFITVLGHLTPEKKLNLNTKSESLRI